MKRKNNKKKFKFSKFKVIRNFTILGLLGVIFFSLKSHAHNEISYKTIIVSQGQTLWKIAKEEQKNNMYYKNKNIKYIIKDIKKLNNLNGATIYINQELQIIEK